MEYEDFVAITIISTGVGCDRKGIKTKVSGALFLQPLVQAPMVCFCQVLNNAEINSLLPQMPALATFTKSLYECNYAEFFKSLGKFDCCDLLPIFRC